MQVLIGIVILVAAMLLLWFFSRPKKKRVMYDTQFPVDTVEEDIVPDADNFSAVLGNDNHIKPKYHGYEYGTYSRACQCRNCKLTGLREDLHPANVCPRCGADEVAEIGGRKWVDENGGEWVS